MSWTLNEFQKNLNGTYEKVGWIVEEGLPAVLEQFRLSRYDLFHKCVQSDELGKYRPVINTFDAIIKNSRR